MPDKTQRAVQYYAKASVVIARVSALLHISNFSLGPSLRNIKRVSVLAPLQQYRGSRGVLHVERIVDGRSVTWPDASPCGTSLYYNARFSTQSAHTGVMHKEGRHK